MSAFDKEGVVIQQTQFSITDNNYGEVEHSLILKIFGDELTYNELKEYTKNMDAISTLKVVIERNNQMESQFVRVIVDDNEIMNKKYGIHNSCDMYYHLTQLDNDKSVSNEDAVIEKAIKNEFLLTRNAIDDKTEGIVYNSGDDDGCDEGIVYKVSITGEITYRRNYYNTYEEAMGEFNKEVFKYRAKKTYDRHSNLYDEDDGICIDKIFYEDENFDADDSEIINEEEMAYHKYVD